MKKIIILGTGGNCVDILETIHEINRVSGTPVYECAGFLDDHKPNWKKEFSGVKVLGPLDSAPDYPDCLFVNGIGSPLNFWRKESIIARTRIPRNRFTTIIHPTASVSPTAVLGSGTVVLPLVTIASNAQIGDHVIVLPQAVVSHDDRIGDYTCIAGGACISGGVSVGRSCYLGANCSIIGNIHIGDYSMIGMGSVVLGHVAENSVMVGNPAQWKRKACEERN